MQVNLDFTGRHVFVFGGTTGINFGIAQAFARQGASVTVASRKQENVDAAHRQLAQFGGPVLGVCADVRDFDAVGRAFAEAVERFGPVDVVVSGAAGNFLCEAKDMSSNGFRVVVDIDLVGTFNVLRQAYGHLRKPGAAVINITAPQSFVPMRYQAHASAAKAGVDQLTRVLALEWGGDGIRINSISPGPIEGTEGFRRLMAPTEAERAAAQSSVPMQRFGTLDDIANLALFLASPYAGYISGALVPCDGGGALESVKPPLEAAGRAAAATGKPA
ncbi:SDR family oxidoreductase [Cupriavidus oxalaticus]|uniref:SDR family oxidoreductase n=1 Tax=Cupriavidus oxalaticus TaxID=96344 RepID=UPI003173AF87